MGPAQSGQRGVSAAAQLTCHTREVAETKALAGRVAGLLRAGDVLLLEGPLGAGKTAFTQGLARGLGLPTEVTSPTFILLAQHPPGTRQLPLYHADLYRLTDPFEVADLHLEEQAQDGVLVVEWPDRAPDELPSQHLRVVIEPSTACPQDRQFRLLARGARHRQLVDQLRGLI